MTEAQYRAFKREHDRMKAEHAPHISVRLNKQYKLEYYNELTGEVVSCHY